MRGGFLHNRVLVDRLEATFQAMGAQTWRESWVSLGDRCGYVDLIADWRGAVAACEAELSADRVYNDISKALAIRASALLIVTPTRPIADAISRKLARLHAGSLRRPGLVIKVLPLGVAVQRVREQKLFEDTVNVSWSTNHQIDRVGGLAMWPTPSIGDRP